MKIQYERFPNLPSKEDSVFDYVDNGINSNVYETGVAERTNQMATLTVESLARLVNVLADKRLLSAREIEVIAGQTNHTSRLIKED